MILKNTNPQFKITYWSFYHQLVISTFSSLIWSPVCNPTHQEVGTDQSYDQENEIEEEWEGGEAHQIRGVIPADPVVPPGLAAGGAVQLAEHHEGQEDENEDDDGHGDAHEDGRVVGVGADPLAPGRLRELVAVRVGAHLGGCYHGVCFVCLWSRAGFV